MRSIASTRERAAPPRTPAAPSIMIDCFIDCFDYLIDCLTSNNQQIIQIIHILFDDYLIDLIDYLTSNNQQIIQIMHVLFDDYLVYFIDYFIAYLMLICDSLIWRLFDLMIIRSQLF